MCCPCWGFVAAPWVGVDSVFANELKSRPQSIRGEKKITANFSKHRKQRIVTLIPSSQNPLCEISQKLKEKKLISVLLI